MEFYFYDILSEDLLSKFLITHLYIDSIGVYYSDLPDVGDGFQSRVYAASILLYTLLGVSYTNYLTLWDLHIILSLNIQSYSGHHS